MERLTEQQIKGINNQVADKWNQGVFKEPWGIDTNEKGYVIYQRHHTGGVSGGSCFSNITDPQPYTSFDKKPKWEALVLVLKEINPDLPYSKFSEILDFTKYSSEIEWGYYGNCSEYDILYLPLEKLYKHFGI